MAPSDLFDRFELQRGWSGPPPRDVINPPAESSHSRFSRAANAAYERRP